MTTSKFHEHLDLPSSTTTSSSSSSPHPDVVETRKSSSSPMRFPQRSSSRDSYKKHTARQCSGDSTNSSTSSSNGNQNTTNAFSGPDADFDFDGRPTVQRLEPTDPSQQERMVQLEKEQQLRDQQGTRRSGQVRNRLRKLSLTAR